MGLKVNISGLRFRMGVGPLKSANQRRILQQRLLNTDTIKVRKGGGLETIRRQPLDLRITEITAEKGLKVDISGLRFRVGDGEVESEDQRGILRGGYQIMPL